MGKYDFDTIIDRDPLKTGSNKYFRMVDSKGNRAPAGIIPMSTADMEFRTAPCAIEAIKKEADFGVFGYHRLTPSFKEAYCGWMERRHDWKVDPDWIVPMDAVVSAEFTAIYAFTKEGDGVLMQNPAYHHFFLDTEKLGRKVNFTDMILKDGKYEIDFDDFEEKAKKSKMFILCSPHNPSGRVWREDELRRMGEICNRYGLLVFADEVHHDLIMPGYKHTVYASLGKEFEQNCVLATSLSKTFNLAGLSYASIIVPNEKLRKAYTDMQGMLSLTHVSRLGPVAQEAAYREGDEWLDEVIDYIHGNYVFMKEWFRKYYPDVFIADLEGTYLVWADFSCFGMTDKELADFLTDECGIYPSNGSQFGPGGTGHERFNIAMPRKALSDALERFRAAMDRRK